MMADEDFDDFAGKAEDQALGGGSRSARGGRGKGGSRRGGGGRSGPGRDVLVSKALSTLLRHQAANAGVELDAEGFARLDKVLQWPRLGALKPTLDEIKAGVADNAKQRFSMKPSNPNMSAEDAEASTDAADWLIRANQGHSIKIANDGLHTPLTLDASNIPPIVVHGTYFAFWPRIVESGGLRAMGRTHVHFGTGLPDGGTGAGQQVHDETDEKSTAEESGPVTPNGSRVISGMRSDAEVLIFVNVEKSLRDGGLKWWLSENGVVLTEGDAHGIVPTKYFKEVRGRRQGVGELWRDGEKVADLPEGIVAKVPQGKRGQGGGGRGGGRWKKRGGLGK